MISNVFNGTLVVVCLLFTGVSETVAQQMLVGQDSQRKEFGKEASSIKASSDLFKLDKKDSRTDLVFGKEIQSIRVKTTIPDEIRLKVEEQLKNSSFGKEAETTRVRFSN